MFDFIKIQYELKAVTADWVKRQCPMWITQEQINIILGGKVYEASV